MRITTEEIAHALYPIIGGTGDLPDEFTGISTDSRTIQYGDLFIALTSDKADGHDFVPVAITNGAAAVMVTRSTMNSPVPAFIVDDTQDAYGQIARIWRDKFDIPVIGVTGSVGKTTTKEMIAAALKPLGSILKTEASQNNETGVPKALLQLTEKQKAAVVEMGMRGPSQIEYLCSVARPTIGLITQIADNHIELLGSRDAIADAKGELIEALPEDGIAFLNANDPYFPRLAAKTKARIIGYGVEGEPTFGDAQFVATEPHLDSGHWQFSVGGQEIVLRSAARHDVTNAVSAFAVAVTVGIDPAAAAAALAAYEAPPMRMEIVNAIGWNGTVINDAYNAAPASMKSALETLKRQSGNSKIAFLGDMKELGDISVEAHEEIGRVIDSLGGIELYTVGELAAHIPGAERRFDNSGEAAAFAVSGLIVDRGDVVLVKGSRAMKMELIAEALASKGLE